MEGSKEKVDAAGNEPTGGKGLGENETKEDTGKHQKACKRKE